jgi:hypothetical protein
MATLLPKDRSEEFGVAGAHFNSFQHLLFVILKNTWGDGFSYDSNSANDE